MLALAPLLAAQLLAPQPAEEQRPAGLVQRAEGAFEGYTLFAPLRATTTYLVDMDGRVVHRWESELRPGNLAYLLDDGHLLRACREPDPPRFHGGGQGGRLQILDWEGAVLWDWSLADEGHLLHHDVEPLPNGNLLAIAWEYRSREEALAAGRDPGEIGADGFWPDVVLEIEPVPPDDARVVWEWRAFDHLVQDLDPALAGYADVTARPERIDVNGDHRSEPPLGAAERAERQRTLEQMRALGYLGDDPDQGDDPAPASDDERELAGDWLHTNAVDYHAAQDLVVLSVRHFSEIWVLDHSTTTEEAAGSHGGRFGKGGDLLYRWGNPRRYGAGGDQERRLFVQHDARFLAPHDAGDVRLLVFDNGTGRPGGDASSVDEIEPPFDGRTGFAREPGAAFGPGQASWTFPTEGAEPFYCSFISGAQRLPNGNTLVCAGPEGRLLEVTREGRVVWEYWNPFGGDTEDERIPWGLFRAERLPADHPGLAGRTLEPLD